MDRHSDHHSRLVCQEPWAALARNDGNSAADAGTAAADMAAAGDNSID